MNEAKNNLGLGDGASASGFPGCLFCPPVRDNRTLECSINLQEHPGGDRSGEELKDFANHVLDKKLTTAVKNIATAAIQTNTWMFTGPQPTTFDVLLQKMIQTCDSEVFTLTAAHVQDKAYMESANAKSMLKKLFESSDVMQGRYIDMFDPVNLTGDFWNPAKNGVNREFHEHGFEYWSFERADQEAAKDHPLVQWPWPWADLFFFFYREAKTAGSYGPEVDWDYTTDKKLDIDSLPLQLDSLAPAGFVFLDGDAQQKRKLFSMLQSARPIVVVDNTPNVSKQMSLFLDIIKLALNNDKNACSQFLLDGARSAGGSRESLLQNISPSKIFKYIEQEYKSSGMEAGARITLSDIVCVIDLVKQRPNFFKETTCVVDPLQDEAEKTIRALASVFCSTYAIGIEGGTSPVNRALVLKGWRLHSKLVHSSMQLGRLGSGVDIFLAAVMFASTVLAVVLIHLRLEKDRLQEMVLTGYMPHDQSKGSSWQPPFASMVDVLNIIMLILPVLGALLMTLQSHFHFAEKWATTHMAANYVVSEIYQFLASVGLYNSSAAANRERFLKRLQEITSHLSKAGIQEDDFMSAYDGSDDLFTTDNEALQNHINASLYGIYPQTLLQRAFASVCQPSRSGSVKGSFAQDLDPTSPLTTGLYMEKRVAPLIKYYTDWARCAAGFRTKLSVTIFLLLGIGSALAAFSRSLWIPVIVGAAAFLTSLAHFMVPSGSIMAVNNALTMLNNMDLHWHGSSYQEQATQSRKNFMITMTERTMLAVASTRSRHPLMPEDEEEIEDFMNMKSDLSMQPATSRPSRSQSRQVSVPGTPGGRQNYAPRSRQHSVPGTPGGRRQVGGSRRWM
jgi:hypothetical protein